MQPRKTRLLPWISLGLAGLAAGALLTTALVTPLNTPITPQTHPKAALKPLPPAINLHARSIEYLRKLNGQSGTWSKIRCMGPSIQPSRAITCELFNQISEATKGKPNRNAIHEQLKSQIGLMAKAQQITPAAYAAFMTTLESHGLSMPFEQQALLGFTLQHNAWPNTNERGGYTIALRFFEDFKKQPDRFNASGKVIKTQFLQPKTLATIQKSLENPTEIRDLCNSWSVGVARGLGYGPVIDLLCGIGDKLIQQPHEKLSKVREIGHNIVQSGGLTQDHLTSLFAELTSLGFQVQEKDLDQALTILTQSGRTIFTTAELRNTIPQQAIRSPSAPTR